MVSGNDAVCSPSLIRRQRLITSSKTLTSPSSLHAPLPTIPFDLIPEILSRLPVKHLLQLKCVCKCWKSLISDPKFARKHLRMSTACRHLHHLITASRNTKGELVFQDSPISSIFSSLSSTSIVPQLQLMFPETTLFNQYPGCVSSCDGILLFNVDLRPPLLWNPSIRKFKILPPLLKPSIGIGGLIYTFGYDPFIDNYKIFAVNTYPLNLHRYTNEVSVYTLGYDSWRRIDDFPWDGPILGAGIFVRGTVNWLAFDASGSSLHVILSLYLEKEKESYQKLLTPNLNTRRWTLGVLMDCLCVFTNGDESLDVWVMKEHGIKESWTKLFSVPYKGFGGTPRFYYMVVYVSEDDLLLLEHKGLVLDSKLIVYNSRNGTFKIPKVQNIDVLMVPKVYVESLISPYS